ELEIGLTLGELPSQRQMAALNPREQAPEEPAEVETVVPELGLELTPATEVEGSGEDGLVITEILDDSNAAEKGLRPGDIILEVGGDAVASVADVASAVAAAKESDRSAVLMRVRSGNATRFVAVTLTEAS
ncbi:MAG: PDZ domain-containing protein, partial [Pseudomonadota bacterium]